MIKLSDRVVLFDGTYLVPQSEQLHVDVPVSDSTLSVTVSFSEAELPDRSPVSWKTEDGRFYLSFHGLIDSAGLRIIQAPVRIGSVGDEPLSLMASVHKHFKAVQIHLQFMSGGVCL